MEPRWELNKVNVGSEGSHILKPSTIPKITIRDTFIKNAEISTILKKYQDRKSVG